MKRKLSEKNRKKVKKAKKKWKKWKKRQKQKNRLEFRFTLFRFEAKITKSKQSEKFKAKKNGKKRKKSGKKRKKVKKSEKIDLNFASLCFTSKQKLPKWSEEKNLKRKDAKRSEKREVKFYSEIVKHKWNGSKFALFRL